MELERNTFNALINYLKEHGYPESSFAIEYSAGKDYRVDLAIIDPQSNLPIQLFEIKSKDDPNIIEFGKNQIHKYLSSINMLDIPAYLVFPSNDPPFFKIQRITTKHEDRTVSDSEESNNYNLLNYMGQKQSRLSKKIEETRESKKETSIYFNKICRLLAGALFVLFLMVKFTSFSLDTIELSILGACIALIIIPFASKLKILGIEFERLKQEKNKS